MRGNDEFFNPEVVAVNKFRQAMNGEKENIQTSADGEVLLVNRGNKGAAIINLANRANPIELPTTLADGEYRDTVYNNYFVVRNGKLYGMLAPEQTYILY